MAIDKVSLRATAALSLLQGAGSGGLFTNKANAAKAKDAVDTLLKNASEEDRAKFKKKIDETNALAEQLKSGGLGSPAQKKADAKQKIDQIKAQMQMLRILAVVDPKAAARRAAQLARELSAAARDYAGASGGGDVTGGADTSGGTAATATTATAPVPATDATAANGGQAAASGGEAVAAQSVVAAAPVVVTDIANTSESAADSGSADASVAAAKGEAAAIAKDAQQATTSPEQARAAYNAALQSKIAAVQKTAGERQEDNDFAKDVRNLATQLKAIIERARQMIKQDKDGKNAGLDHELNEGLKALQEVEKTLGDLTSGALPGSDAGGAAVGPTGDTGTVSTAVSGSVNVTA